MNSSRFFKSFSEKGLWLCAGATLIIHCTWSALFSMSSSLNMDGSPKQTGHFVSGSVLSSLLRLNFAGKELGGEGCIRFSGCLYASAILANHCVLQLQIFFCFLLDGWPFISVASDCLLGRCYVLSASPGHQQLQLVLLFYFAIFPAKPCE